MPTPFPTASPQGLKGLGKGIACDQSQDESESHTAYLKTFKVFVSELDYLREMKHSEKKKKKKRGREVRQGGVASERRPSVRLCWTSVGGPVDGSDNNAKWK